MTIQYVVYLTIQGNPTSYLDWSDMDMQFAFMEFGIMIIDESGEWDEDTSTKKYFCIGNQDIDFSGLVDALNDNIKRTRIPDLKVIKATVYTTKGRVL